MLPPASLIRGGSPQPSPETLVRRLAANVAHNLNNNLTGAIGYLELALREAEPDSLLQDHLRNSLSCSLRVAEMVRRILAFAYQPAGPTQSAVVSLRQIAEHLTRALREPQARNGLDVNVRAESDGLIRANSTLLHLVLDQLISNAQEATPAGGVLSFRVWDE